MILRRQTDQWVPSAQMDTSHVFSEAMWLNLTTEQGIMEEAKLVCNMSYTMTHYSVCPTWNQEPEGHRCKHSNPKFESEEFLEVSACLASHNLTAVIVLSIPHALLALCKPPYDTTSLGHSEHATCNSLCVSHHTTQPHSGILGMPRALFILCEQPQHQPMLCKAH